MVFAGRVDFTTTPAIQHKPCEFVAPPPPPGNPPCDVGRVDDVTQVYLTKHDSLISGESLCLLPGSYRPYIT